jgi:hypothetical protein
LQQKHVEVATLSPTCIIHTAFLTDFGMGFFLLRFSDAGAATSSSFVGGGGVAI